MTNFYWTNSMYFIFKIVNSQNRQFYKNIERTFQTKPNNKTFLLFRFLSKNIVLKDLVLKVDCCVHRVERNQISQPRSCYIVRLLRALTNKIRQLKYAGGLANCSCLCFIDKIKNLLELITVANNTKTGTFLL